MRCWGWAGTSLLLLCWRSEARAERPLWTQWKSLGSYGKSFWLLILHTMCTRPHFCPCSPRSWAVPLPGLLSCPFQSLQGLYPPIISASMPETLKDGYTQKPPVYLKQGWCPGPILRCSDLPVPGYGPGFRILLFSQVFSQDTVALLSNDLSP